MIECKRADNISIGGESDESDTIEFALTYKVIDYALSRIEARDDIVLGL